MNRSLRSQLLISIAATVVAGFAVAAVAIFVRMRASLLHEFDTSLASKARALATLIEQRGDVFEIEFADHPMQEFARKISPEFYQVWDDTGKVVARSRRLTESDLFCDLGSLAAPTHRFLVLPDGRPGRQVAVQFFPAVDGETLAQELGEEEQEDEIDDDEIDQIDFSRRRRVTLVVARETAEIDETLSRLVWMLFGVSTAVTVTTLAVMAWLVTRRLSPLEQLAARIADLDEHELTARISVDNAPRELDPVIRRLNELLTTLEEAFQRERLFSADVAHELRTPLAGLRSTLEVVLRKDRGKEEYRQALHDCEEISVDTQRLVETLLSLARIESGQTTIDPSFVDLETLLDKSWELHRAQAHTRGLRVTFGGPSGVFLNTDSSQLRVVIANLLSNAVDYNEDGGSIDVCWGVDPQGFHITFANSSRNLSEAQVGHVFDRFWRADTARAATGAHAGLGLALCERIIHMLGGLINAECLDSRFVVTIGFPPGFVVPSDLACESEDQLPGPGAIHDENCETVLEARLA